MKSEVVVITGATAGVGLATVHVFAKRKACIGLIARDLSRLQKTAQEAIDLGAEVLIFPLDVANSDAVEAAAESMKRKFGTIDIWINNAMVSVFSPANQMTAKEFKRVTEVTYLGYVYGTLAALKQMLPRDQGMIIQVGSALAYRGIPLQSAYSAAKHAVQGFTESVRCELMHVGSHVKISMIQLPAINTPQFGWVKSRLPRKPQPVPPVYQPEIAADAIFFATKHYRRQWYIGGSTLLAIVGNKVAAGIGDWYLAKKGYEAQQYNGLVDPNRPNNLFESVPGDVGSHGDFDKVASHYSLQLWISRYRLWVFIGVALGILYFVLF